MDLNKLKLLSKEDLLQKLKQSGFNDVVTIIGDKGIDGAQFVDLKEFETFKWRLSVVQKKCLWNCVRDVRTNPSLLLMKEKPKVLEKLSCERQPSLSETSNTKLFKGKLEGLLGTPGAGPGSSSSLPRKPPLPRKATIPSLQVERNVTQAQQRQVSQVSVTTSGSRKPAELPPNETNKIVIKRPAPTLPQRNEIKNSEDGEDYMDMQPPKKSGSDDEDYLTPNEIAENNYEAPPNIINRENYTSDANLSSRSYLPMPKTITNNRKSDDNNQPVLKKRTLLSPNINLKVTSNRKYVVEPSPVETQKDHSYNNIDIKPFMGFQRTEEAKIRMATQDNPPSVYKPSPSPSLKSINTHRDIRGEQINTTTNVYSNESLGPSTVNRPSIKDLENVLQIEDKGVNQETPVLLSKITNTLSNIFRKNKSKNCYENCTIKDVESETTITNTIRQRPLPKVPSLTISNTPDKHIFSKAFPIPRVIPSVSKPQNYIEIISSTKESPLMHEEDDQEYVNTINPRTLSINSGLIDRQQSPILFHHSLDNLHLQTASNNAGDSEDEENVYENTPKVNPFKNKATMVTFQEKKSSFNRDGYIDKSRDLYRRGASSEISSSYKEDADDESEQIYENPGKTIPAWDSDSYVQLVKGMDDAYQDTSKHTSESEEEDTFYANTADVIKNDTEYQNTMIQAQRPSFVRGGLGMNNPTKAINNAPTTKTENATNNEQSVCLQDTLATLLAQKLKEREKILQKEKTNHVDDTTLNQGVTNSSKRYTAPSFNLSSNSEESFSDSDESDGHHDHRQREAVVPIHKRPLPEIPKDSDASASTIRKSPSVSMRRSPSSVQYNEDNLTYENVVGTSPKRSPMLSSNRPANKFEVAKKTSTEKLGRSLQIPPKSTQHYYELYHSNTEIKNESQGTSGTAEPHEHNRRLLNVNNEPFYRNTNRNGAKQLLRGLDNGAFLLRPGETYFLVLTIKHKNKFYNLGIEKVANKIRLNAEGGSMAPEFESIKEFVDYFLKEPVTFQENNAVVQIYLKPLLTRDI